jgi:hypothetical protein
LLEREPLSRTIAVTMGISNYRNDVFRDCFSG